MIKTLTDKDFTEETSAGVTLTDFWATWCAPCRMQGPIIEQLDQELGDAVKISKLNVDDNPETPDSFGIMSIPTLLIKKNGETVKKLVGVHTKAQLKTILSEYTN